MVAGDSTGRVRGPWHPGVRVALRKISGFPQSPIKLSPRQGPSMTPRSGGARLLGDRGNCYVRCVAKNRIHEGGDAARVALHADGIRRCVGRVGSDAMVAPPAPTATNVVVALVDAGVSPHGRRYRSSWCESGGRVAVTLHCIWRQRHRDDQRSARFFTRADELAASMERAAGLAPGALAFPTVRPP